ncbi:T9SS type A sorting domain-containing protein [Hymenobacter sp. B81]|uniref:T9SS type A sorting domain-containing protein n=1 Tax=Hymenobacter sp. B81 TaxID=3344878 RepID=UPI0037DC8CE4
MQPDGKIVVAGRFTNNNLKGLVRLEASGSIDNSLASPFSISAGSTPEVLALQPDGKLLVGSLFPITNGKALVRLLPSGALDPQFQLEGNVSFSFFGDPREFSDPVVLPNGQILVPNAYRFSGDPSLVKLNPNGSKDAAFQVGSGSLGASQGTLNTVAVRPNGQLFVAGRGIAPPGRQGDAVLLQANGLIDAGFTTTLLKKGVGNAVARQPDGAVLVGGLFTAVNGVDRKNLVRLLPTGAVDPGFNPGNTGDYVRNVQVQPDGKVLVLSLENQMGSVDMRLSRLLPNGASDPAFVLDNFVLGTEQFRVLPNGSIMLLGDSVASGRTLRKLWRMLPNGALDRSFRSQPANDFVSRFEVQPDGRILVLGRLNEDALGTPAYVVKRLLPSGLPDPAFTPYPFASQPTASWLAAQPDGGVIVADQYPSSSGAAPRVARLLASGAPDPGFSASLPAPVPFSSIYTEQYTIKSLVMQPNGRILLGGGQIGWVRLLPTGQADVGFNPKMNGEVNDVAIGPNGHLLAVGAFTRALENRAVGVASFLDAHVLPARSAQASADFAVWPVPTRATLYLRLEAAARPRQISVYNAVGQCLRQQAATAAPTQQLSVAGLPSGVYLLRVDYADGPVTRRVVVE